ncbi:guanylate kinase [Candidatus Kaiserbacteria bacterium]|nr:guanylate kinase [Candidatus Kaiserbacteria bacterium]
MADHDFTGHLIVFVGTPGSGKGVLREYVREVFPQLHFAVSCTTRTRRPGEIDGKDYFFITKEEFQKRIDEGAFLEWIEQDGGNMYGTLKSEILEPLARGEVVVREVEVRGVEAIRNIVPAENRTIIFIEADTWDILQRRIQERAPISPEELEKRRERYERERLFMPSADIVVHNYDGKLDDAQRELKDAIAGILEKVVQ